MSEKPQESIVFDTPDGIEYAQLCSVKQAIKLESKGLKMSRGRSVKGVWAEKFGLSVRAKPEDVIARIDRRREFLLAAKALDVTSKQLHELAAYADKHGKGWKEDLNASWTNGGDHAPELQQLRNEKGPEWLANLKVEFQRA